MAAQTISSSAMLSSAQRTPLRAAPSASRRACSVRTSAVAHQDDTRETAPRVQRAMQASAKVLVSIAAAQMALMPLSGVALAVSKDDADMGPNEVDKSLLSTVGKDSDNPYDTAMPGRSGGVFGGSAPGDKDAGAVDEQKVKEKAEEGAAKASSVLDKIKDALPFGVLPTFDLAVTKDDADMGPNEVDKDLLGSVGKDSNNPFDTAMPGRSGEVFGSSKPGENDAGAVDVGKVEEKKQEAGNVLQKIKDALPFGVLPIYDVAVDEQTADLGPNEVTQKTLGNLPGANKFDQAAPGRAGSTSDAPKAGQSVKNTVGAAKSKVDEGAGKAKKFFGLF